MQKSKEMLFQKRQLVLLASFLSTSSAFVSPLQSHGVIPKAFVPASRNTVESSSALNLFGKMFEEEGPLGKGITVGKVQVALQAKDRGPTSIFGMLEESSNEGGDSPYELAQFGNEVCLALLRKSDEWTAACSSSEWFSENDAGKAERTFNDLANKEAMKFEKEYIPPPGSKEESGGVTSVVVSIILEIQGDITNFEGAGYSVTGTKDVLSSIAADCVVEDGECLNAIEVFWTPSDRKEVLSPMDLIADFPELVTL